MKTETRDSVIDFEHSLRRSQGRAGRVFAVTAKVTDTEKRVLDAAAAQTGKALSEWAREALLREASRPTNDVLLMVLVAARMMLVNLSKTVELDPDKARHIEYGYAADGLKRIQADRVLATGETLKRQSACFCSVQRARPQLAYLEWFQPSETGAAGCSQGNHPTRNPAAGAPVPGLWLESIIYKPGSVVQKAAGHEEHHHPFASM